MSELATETDQVDWEALGLLRVAAVTPELTLGDVKANVKHLERAAKSLVAQGCRLLVFPELCLTGYSCADLFHQSALQEAALKGLGALALATENLPAVLVVGLPLAHEDRLYNVAAVLCAGKVMGVVPKRFLPNSEEFYERRWFAPAVTLSADSIQIGGLRVPFGTDLVFKAIDIPGFTLGVEICEDLWSVTPPSGRLALSGATVLANPSASNEILGKAPYRRQLVGQQSARCLAAYVYASAGAGESSTDLVFSGHSLVAENGVLMDEGERFSFETRAAVADVDLPRLVHDRQRSAAFRDEPAPEGMRRVEFEMGERMAGAPTQLRRYVAKHPFVPSQAADRAAVCEEIFAIQATGLARRVRQVRPKKLVLGLSGGLDSTLAMLVALNALERAGEESSVLLTVTMPGFGTTERTRGNAEKLAEALGVELDTVLIGPAVKQHFADIGHPENQHDVTFENAQARERTQVLMDLANRYGGLVIGTGDLSESALGWCTFNGDHMSMYHVNAGVPKTLVRYLIEWCAEELHAEKAGAVLHDICATPITPELLPVGAGGELEQKTEDTIGPYELHDFFLYQLVRCGSSAKKIHALAMHAFDGVYEAAVVAKWLDIFLKRFATSQFKRSSMPDGPKVGTVALSPRGDWRMPSDFAGKIADW